LKAEGGCFFADPEVRALGKSMVFAVAAFIRVTFPWHLACMYHGTFTGQALFIYGGSVSSVLSKKILNSFWQGGQTGAP